MPQWNRRPRICVAGDATAAVEQKRQNLALVTAQYLDVLSSASLRNKLGSMIPAEKARPVSIQ